MIQTAAQMGQWHCRSTQITMTEHGFERLNVTYKTQNEPPMFRRLVFE